MLTAAIIGATGSVGSVVLNSLSRNPSFGKIIVLNRRSVDYSQHPKVTQHVIEMEDVSPGGAIESAAAGILKSSDCLFSTMGVGAPSKASAEAFLKADLEIPSAVARGARRCGVKHVSILTAVGADHELDASSGLVFGAVLPEARAGGALYNSTKGTLEKRISDMNFDSASTFRPAALVGSPNTPAILSYVSVILDKVVPSKYMSCDIKLLGNAMVKDACDRLSDNVKEKGSKGDMLNIYEGDNLQEGIMKDVMD
jgi:nucleoside-diphosphate-sugar epimerase